MSTPVHREGLAPFVFNGEPHQTWYNVVGDISSSPFPPLIVLHGGPGLSHDYLLPLSDLTASPSASVIFYDQLGNGRSTRLPDKPRSFWNMDLFMDELDNLIAHLRISTAFDIIGHSYGGMLAAQYVVERQPPGLRHLILSNAFASMDSWNQSLAQLVQQFPSDVQEGLRLGISDVGKYEYGLMKFYQVHGCTVRPFPAEFSRTFNYVFGENRDISVATAMFPYLQGWSIIDRLHHINVPTLVINGRADFAQDFTTRPFFERIKKVKWLTLENSSHMPFWEERDRYMQEVGSFLASEDP
ncbi:proline-specific peptidase [Daedalea quercina L-15889]|uniref:Proline-specific peptidase n=1 Tax=Daedalea quercina L-15889 TaxID=1314783 RepID=A0A165LR46_9APHY|nr:proline-specific peptidase [Daedalea quercina L-15889]